MPSFPGAGLEVAARRHLHPAQMEGHVQRLGELRHLSELVLRLGPLHAGAASTRPPDMDARLEGPASSTRIALGPREVAAPRSLGEVVVGNVTAREIGWMD